MTFQSKFEENQKLKDCAVNDKDHISEIFSPRGPWVNLIQEALNTWAQKQNPPEKQITVSGNFDSKTGDLTALFKRRQKPPLLNFRGQIDRIVGKQTVVALDKELPALRIPVTVVTKTVDVIVKFAGTLGAVRPLLPQEVFSLDSSRFENPDNPVSTYKLKANREILRIGQTTITIRSASANLIAITIRQIKSALNDSIIGKIIVFGSSSGGRNALDLAAALTNENLPLVYVGILDAAFFPNESLNFPDNFTGEPTVIPRFAVSNISGNAKKDNFFQKLGNHSEVSAVRGRLFTSSMGGRKDKLKATKEIHGQIDGFNNEDFTGQVKATHPADTENFTFDDICHINLTKVATPVMFGRINSILDNL